MPYVVFWFLMAKQLNIVQKLLLAKGWAQDVNEKLQELLGCPEFGGAQAVALTGRM